MFIDDLIINAKNRWYLEKESGDHLVEVLGTIIVAIALLVVFRGKIKDAFDTNLDKVSTQLAGLFGTPAGT